RGRDARQRRQLDRPGGAAGVRAGGLRRLLLRRGRTTRLTVRVDQPITATVPEPSTARVPRRSAHLAPTHDHVVDDAVLLGALGGEPAVTVGVLVDLVLGLTGVERDALGQQVLDVLELLGLDGDVGRLALHAR